MLSVDVETALDRIELNVAVTAERGRCVALVGPSGSGKTTTLRQIAGLVRPDRGRVSLDGEPWLDTASGTDLPPEERRCGFLFQEYALFPHLTAWQNVAFGLGDLPRGERRRRAIELLDRFGLAGAADARPRGLSGGERQRVALARAIARQPGALLLDEPLAALDPATRSRAGRELVSTLRAVGVPAVLVTHDFAEAALLADEIAVLDRGSIVQRGTPGELSARPASPFVADFAGAAVLTGRARPGEGRVTIVDLDGGGTISSTDQADGAVAVAVYPWEITLEPPGAAGEGSALNHLPGRVTSITEIGNRARVGLEVPQALAAEVTGASLARLGLAPGARVTANWKATATRLIPR